MKYNPIEIEAKWQKYWADNKTFAYKLHSLTDLAKYKTKHMFWTCFLILQSRTPHVGIKVNLHLMSILDIKTSRVQCFASMGYDSFGLPAEQYAIQTGQRPERPRV
jgi:leucyl-tRNA synthetase